MSQESNADANKQHATDVTQAQTTQNQRRPQPANGKTVLIVDDDEINRRAYAEMLELQGIHVLSAKDGIEALEQYRAHAEHIHLVILDVMMPRMNGADTLRAIRTLNPQCCCLMVTGYIDAKPLETVIEQGVSGILRKPFGMSELIAWVNKIFIEDKCRVLSP